MTGMILLIIGFMVIAMLWNEGMWSNAVAFMNIFFAGMITTNYFEPVAEFLEDNLPSFTYLLDYVAFWFLFAFVYNVLRAVTDQISKHQVRFRKPVEHTGRILFALLAAWTTICIFSASLHLSPLAETPLKGSFAKEPLSSCFFGMSPDRYWLAFFHSRSGGGQSGKGAMSSGAPFDANGEFTLKYAARRYNFEEHNRSTDGKMLVRKP